MADGEMTVGVVDGGVAGGGRASLWLDMLLVLVPGAAVFVLGSMGGFFMAGPVGVLVSTVMVWVVCRRRGAGLGAVGLDRKHPWWLTLLMALGVLVAGGLIVNVGVATFAYLVTGELPDTSALDPVRGNTGQFLLMLLVSWTTAGFGEELVFRGFLMTWLRRALGGRAWVWGVALVAQGVLFGVAHSYQGLSGMILVSGVGIVMGGAYLLCRRNLWVVILAHGLTDTLAMVLLYLDLLPATPGGA